MSPFLDMQARLPIEMPFALRPIFNNQPLTFTGNWQKLQPPSKFFAKSALPNVWATSNLKTDGVTLR
jgi:hypothetical protein